MNKKLQRVLEQKAKTSFIISEDVEFADQEEDPCDYTGEQCCGDRMFCEECIIWEELEKSVKQKSPQLSKER